MQCEQVFWVLEGNEKGVDVKLRLLVSVQYRAGGKGSHLKVYCQN